jgi:enhancer-of-filamentation protein 1
MQLAVALYNNNVDDEDELEFRKGDILTVLIENPNGLNGWWLCEHNGKCGLCPGNRLKLISNTVSSAIKSTEPTRSSSRLSTASVSSQTINRHLMNIFLIRLDV